MTYLTEDEEAKLDKNLQIILKRGNKQFIIDKSKVYCYGVVDFNDYSDDLDEIATFSFLDYLGAVGIHIPNDYDYETHTCNSPLSRVRYRETWCPELVAQYAHGMLGKPERIVLFIAVW